MTGNQDGSRVICISPTYCTESFNITNPSCQFKVGDRVSIGDPENFIPYFQLKWSTFKIKLNREGFSFPLKILTELIFAFFQTGGCVLYFDLEINKIDAPDPLPGTINLHKPYRGFEEGSLNGVHIIWSLFSCSSMLIPA